MTETSSEMVILNIATGETSTVLVPYTSPPDVTLQDCSPVSKPQMLAALIITGVITEAEGEAWAQGTLPADVLAAIAELDGNSAIVAKMRAISATTFDPRDPLVSALAAMKGKTTEDLIQIFQLAATL